MCMCLRVCRRRRPCRHRRRCRCLCLCLRACACLCLCVCVDAYVCADVYTYVYPCVYANAYGDAYADGRTSTPASMCSTAPTPVHVSRYVAMWRSYKVSRATTALWTSAIITPIDCNVKAFEEFQFALGFLPPEVQWKLRPIARPECLLKFAEGVILCDELKR